MADDRNGGAFPAGTGGPDDVPPWDPRAFAGNRAGPSGPTSAGPWTEPGQAHTHHESAPAWSRPHDAPAQPDAPDPAPDAGRASGSVWPHSHHLQQLTVVSHDRTAERRRKGPLLALAAGAVAMLVGAAAGGWVWARSGMEPTSPTSSIVTSPTGRIVAADYFERTAASGFGKADVGSTWALLARTKAERSHYKVDQGRANFEIDRGVRCTAYLAEEAVVSSDVLVSLATDTQPTAGGLYVGLMTRASGPSRGLLTEVFIQRDDSVRVRLQKVLGAGKGDVTTLDSTSTTLPGALPRDAVIYIRTQTVGTAPTILRTKVWWGERSAEPVEWSSGSRIEGDRDFRDPGGIAITGYLSKEAATAGVNVSLFAVEAHEITG